MEIERKFLTKEIPFSLEGFVCKQIMQSYISFEPTIRIRKSNEQYQCIRDVKYSLDGCK